MGLDAANLYLEKVTEQHAEILYPYLSDSRLYEYLEVRIPTLAETSRKFKFAALEKSPDNDTMIWLKWVATNFRRQHVGVVEIGLFEDGYAEIGFMTFVDFQNQGYASAYCSLALAKVKQCFSSFTLHASINEQNLVSCKVIEKLGFELYQVNKNAEFIKGKQSDELIYRMSV
ncbi:MAG: GNAT family N-acetyltransferase [Brasilonema sp.]